MIAGPHSQAKRSQVGIELSAGQGTPAFETIPTYLHGIGFLLVLLLRCKPCTIAWICGLNGQDPSSVFAQCHIASRKWR